MNKLIISDNSDLVNIADAIRSKTGGNDSLSLDEMVVAINNIEVGGSAEDLDTELDTQATLLSEQDSKIAELAEILAGKAGGGDSGSSSTISVTIYNDDMSMIGAYYFDENGMVQNVYPGPKTVDALNGIVFTRTSSETINASGNYVSSNAMSVSAVRFLEDGGTATVSMTM